MPDSRSDPLPDGRMLSTKSKHLSPQTPTKYLPRTCLLIMMCSGAFCATHRVLALCIGSQNSCDTAGGPSSFVVGSPRVAVTSAEPYQLSRLHWYRLATHFHFSQGEGGLFQLGPVQSPRLCGGCRVQRPLLLCGDKGAKLSALTGNPCRNLTMISPVFRTMYAF